MLHVTLLLIILGFGGILKVIKYPLPYAPGWSMYCSNTYYMGATSPLAECMPLVRKQETTGRTPTCFRAGSIIPSNGTVGIFMFNFTMHIVYTVIYKEDFLMLGPFSRTEMLIGSEGMDKLKKATVAIFGIGGVGSYTAEALARCNIGKLVLIDDDVICLTNINRQIHATTKTVGCAKVEVMAERIKDINPGMEVVIHKKFYSSESADELLSKDYDYVADAIDTVSGKIDLAVRCTEMGIPIISSMGAGNKLDPTGFEVMDLYKTSICPLAKVMRYELRKRGIKKLKVVCSKEQPIKPYENSDFSCNENCICPPSNERKSTQRKQIPGSISFVPSAVGLIIASEIVKDLIK